MDQSENPQVESENIAVHKSFEEKEKKFFVTLQSRKASKEWTLSKIKDYLFVVQINF